MDEHFDDKVLADLESDRRAFLKRMAATAAIAAPFIASFDMSEGISAASADSKVRRAVVH